MSERDDDEREFDLKWADGAEHKEPSARARMLAARWKENPPGPVPFRPDPEHSGSRRRSRSARSARSPHSSRFRSSWVSTAVVLGGMAAVILLLGYLNFRAP
ncbi:SCO2583/SCO2584 N-terminal domain-containing protein [Streptomyces poriticola]|uniref:SCO2583/SCO2584 N-terminal domain-containing protein n=1 Tax=Streptomyces poriticola TaxID=3120506 RepID=UPI002FCE3A7D